MSIFEFVIFSLATYRVARLIVRDEIFYGMREKVFHHYPPETTRIGYLFTCQWCSSVWIGLVFVIWYTINADIASFFAVALALSAVAGLLTAYEDRN